MNGAEISAPGWISTEHGGSAGLASAGEGKGVLAHAESRSLQLFWMKVSKKC